MYTGGNVCRIKGTYYMSGIKHMLKRDIIFVVVAIHIYVAHTSYGTLAKCVRMVSS